MKRKPDVLRAAAEREFGGPISDELWEKSRPAWKRWLHGVSYGMKRPHHLAPVIKNPG